MSQPQQRIMDSHIHLWPSTATSPSSHGWMKPGHFLSKRHGISDYLSIASPTGFIYVETDRYLPSHFPPATPNDADDAAQQDQILAQWAHQPLQELSFLRRVTEATPAPDDSDGFTPQNAEKMKGCVVYAPFHLTPALFSRYMTLAREAAGPRLWPKVVGFRYLLQGKGEGGVRSLLTGENGKVWAANLSTLRKERGGRGAAFDVGVDVNRDGYEGLDAVQALIRKVREQEEQEGVERGRGVRFVLNHLTKHPLSPSSPSPNPHWRNAIAFFAPDSAVYIKFSGGFNEFVDTPSTPADVSILLNTLTPFFDHVFESFGPQRILFGSDWPVCNVGGPKGEEGNWELWREVVEKWMMERGLSEEQKEWIWWRAAEEAYALDE